MANRNTSIRINGKHYDALTGSLLSPVAPAKRPTKSIDGVVGSSTHKTPAVHTPKTSVAPRSQAVRSAAPHAAIHKTTSAKTLMRHAVAKPAQPSLKRRTKVHTATTHSLTPTIAPTATVLAKTSFISVNEQRLARARSVAMSPTIARFAREVPAITASFSKAFVIPETPTEARMYRPDVMPVKQASATTSDIFEQALQRATSHEQLAPIVPSSKRSRRVMQALRRRMVSYGAGALAVLAIAGVFGPTQASHMQFRAASNRAGFAATLPSYRPAGFSVGEIRTSGGYVALKYVAQANTNHAARNYILTEKATSIDSETLLYNITVSSASRGYATVQKAGKTIYVYGSNQAAWVHKGILYQVLGNGALSTNDFTQIATSM